MVKWQELKRDKKRQIRGSSEIACFSAPTMSKPSEDPKIRREGLMTEPIYRAYISAENYRRFQGTNSDRIQDKLRVLCKE
jgi:hypothetical protein